MEPYGVGTLGMGFYSLSTNPWRPIQLCGWVIYSLLWPSRVLRRRRTRGAMSSPAEGHPGTPDLGCLPLFHDSSLCLFPAVS